MARRPQAPTPQPASLTPDQKRAAIPRLEKRIAELEQFAPGAIESRSDTQITTLEQAVDRTLTDVFGHDTVEYKRYQSAQRLDTAGYSMGRPTPRADVVAGLERGKARAIATLQGIIAGFREDLEEFTEGETIVQTVTAPAHPNRVFIVHGHDGTPREAVARFVERIGLEPLILHDMPNAGRTIFTKFQEEAGGAGYAVVLLTPDDVGRSKREENLQDRARQNVILELGFFIGKLGPERVAAIVRGDVELPSDFDGVVYIRFEDNDSWKLHLGRELQAAGYEVDWNRVMK